MLNRWTAWLGLALLVAFLGYAATLSSSYSECQTAREETYTSKNQPDFFEKADTIIVCEGVAGDANGVLLTALATIAVAAFTLTLWLTSKEQGRIAQQSIDLGRDEFNATHRPDIIVHNFEVARDTLGNGTAVGAQFVVVNKGTAEATILDIAGTIFMTVHLRPGSTMPSIGYAGRRLAVGEPLSDVAIFGTTLDTAAVDLKSGFGGRSAAGDAKLWCIGRIAYADNQGRRRETGFCRSYDIVGERWIKESESDYEYAY